VKFYSGQNVPGRANIMVAVTNLIMLCDAVCVQTWHKICFKCTECNMILNMRNYKGFDKMPYCNAYVVVD